MRWYPGLALACLGFAGTALAITVGQAEKQVASLPEYREMANRIDHFNRMHPQWGPVRLGIMADKRQQPVVYRSDRYWTLNLVENHPDHLHRAYTFWVSLDGRKMLVDCWLDGSGRMIPVGRYRALRRTHADHC